MRRGARLPSALALAAVALACCAPSALALDVLPSESRLGDEVAVLVVRADGPLVVRTEPPVVVALRGEERGALAPRTLVASGTWRGMEGVLELRLEREHPAATVHIYLEDEGGAGARSGAAGAVGAWIEWPGAASAVSAAAARETPGSAVLLAVATLALGAAFMRPRAGRRACGTR